MLYKDKYGNGTDNIQDAVDMTDDEYNEKIEDYILEIVDDSSALEEVIIYSDRVMKTILSMYKAHYCGNLEDMNFWAKTICFDIDEALLEDAERNV